MTQEPADTRHLYVPLRDAGCAVTLRLFRDRDGSRCAVGFTTAEHLARVLGPQQRCYRLTEHSARTLAQQCGVNKLIVDPGLVAAAVAQTSADQRTEPVTAPVPQPVGPSRSTLHPEVAGLLAVSAAAGAAALLMQVLP
jgi:hypothetical protein